ncbi:MAG: hypothetical protein VW946_04980 [Gammaproteobacteria bacterium]
MNLLIEDLTDEFYESGTDEIKRWLIVNISDKSKTNINNMDHDDLLDLFLETSFEMLGMTFKHKNGRRGN